MRPCLLYTTPDPKNRVAPPFDRIPAQTSEAGSVGTARRYSALKSSKYFDALRRHLGAGTGKAAIFLKNLAVLFLISLFSRRNGPAADFLPVSGKSNHAMTVRRSL